MNRLLGLGRSVGWLTPLGGFLQRNDHQLHCTDAGTPSTPSAPTFAPAAPVQHLPQQQQQQRTSDWCKRTPIQQSAQPLGNQRTLFQSWGAESLRLEKLGLPPANPLPTYSAPAPRTARVPPTKNIVGRPPSLRATPEPPKRARGRPRKLRACAGLDGAPVSPSSATAQGPSNGSLDAEVPFPEEPEAPSAEPSGPQKARYHRWTTQERELGAQALRACGGHVQQALDLLLGTFWNTFQGLVRSTLSGPAWQGDHTRPPTGREKTLPAAVLQNMGDAIRQQMSAGVPVFSVMLRPLLVQCVRDGGLGHLLVEEGGPFKMSTSWVNRFCCSLGLVMRAGTTAAQKVPENAVELCLRMNQRVAYLAWKHDIPAACCVNWDQTGLMLCPISHMSRAPLGAKDVPLVGQEDRRQITATIAAAADGTMLKPQLIFTGKTPQSLPSGIYGPAPGPKGRQNEGPLLEAAAQFEGWHMTFSDNHWASQETMQELMEFIIDPYFKGVKERLQLKPEQKCIIIMDCWSVHKSAAFLTHIRVKYPYIIPLFVPAGCTSVGQVMDLCVNRPIKNAMQGECAIHMSKQVAQHAIQLKKDPNTPRLQLGKKLSELKPLLPWWFYKGYIRCQPPMILAGWKAAGTDRAWGDAAFLKEAILANEQGLLFVNSGGSGQLDTPSAADEQGQDDGLDTDSDTDPDRDDPERVVFVGDLADVSAQCDPNAVAGSRPAMVAKRSKVDLQAVVAAGVAAAPTTAAGGRGQASAGRGRGRGRGLGGRGNGVLSNAATASSQRKGRPALLFAIKQAEEDDSKPAPIATAPLPAPSQQASRVTVAPIKLTNASRKPASVNAPPIPPLDQQIGAAVPSIKLLVSAASQKPVDSPPSKELHAQKPSGTAAAAVGSGSSQRVPAARPWIFKGLPSPAAHTSMLSAPSPTQQALCLSQPSGVRVKTEPGLSRLGSSKGRSTFVDDPEVQMLETEELSHEDRAREDAARQASDALFYQQRQQWYDKALADKIWLQWSENGYSDEEKWWRSDEGRSMEWHILRTWHWSPVKFNKWRTDDQAVREKQRLADEREDEAMIRRESAHRDPYYGGRD